MGFGVEKGHPTWEVSGVLIVRGVVPREQISQDLGWWLWSNDNKAVWIGKTLASL